MPTAVFHFSIPLFQQETVAVQSVQPALVAQPVLSMSAPIATTLREIKRERCDTIYKSTIACMQVRSSLFGKSLEKVSVYGADQYPGVSPVCVLFSGAHYDTLVQIAMAT